jgi:hypothetical protein
MTVRLNSSTYGMAFTNDYFASQHLKQTYYWYFTKPETGNVQAEVFGIKNDYSSNLDFILHTTDYGLNVATIAVDSSVVYNADGIQALKICHGTMPGEVYLVTTNPPVVDSLPYVYKIYHSIDNGESFGYRSSFSFGNSDVYTDFTGGRDEGSFYVVNWLYKPEIQKQILQVYYSSNYAADFEEHQFLLDQFVENLRPASDKIELFPNPANTKATIKGALLKNTDEIGITDISGKEIALFLKEMNQAELNIDCSKYENGLYLVNLYSSGKLIKSLKLLVNH